MREGGKGRGEGERGRVEGISLLEGNPYQKPLSIKEIITRSFYLSRKSLLEAFIRKENLYWKP